MRISDWSSDVCSSDLGSILGKLDGKVALVTGSGRGIGRAIALKLAGEGARVVVNDLDEEPGDAVAREVRDRGGEAIAVNGSVTSDGFAERFVGAAMEQFDGLDIIVNNAGYTWDASIQNHSDEQFEAMRSEEHTSELQTLMSH